MSIWMKHFPGSVIDKFKSPKARMNLVASRAAGVKSVKRKMVGDLIREVSSGQSCWALHTMERNLGLLGNMIRGH